MGNQKDKYKIIKTPEQLMILLAARVPVYWKYTEDKYFCSFPRKYLETEKQNWAKYVFAILL